MHEGWVALFQKKRSSFSASSSFKMWQRIYTQPVLKDGCLDADTPLKIIPHTRLGPLFFGKKR